jgi:hypothetical protein
MAIPRRRVAAIFIIKKQMSKRGRCSSPLSASSSSGGEPEPEVRVALRAAKIAHNELRDAVERARDAFADLQDAVDKIIRGVAAPARKKSRQ